MYIAITGGTGFVGTHLCKKLRQEGHKVIVVGPNIRPKHDNIDYIQANLMQGEVPLVFSECDTIIHLAGANIFHRWTHNYKQLIVDSRVKTAEAIYHFLSKQQRRPESIISASAVGFYGDRGDEVLDESSDPGRGFLALTCIEWEKTIEKFSLLGMRTASLRTATVLGQKGGALSKMIPFFQWGLGGKFGKGCQWFPWIHIDDLVAIYMQATLDTRINGPINAVAPELIRNRDFVDAIKAILKKPAFVSLPSYLLRLFLGEMASVVLSSQKVQPCALEKLGFSFKYPTIHQALTECL